MWKTQKRPRNRFFSQNVCSVTAWRPTNTSTASHVGWQTRVSSRRVWSTTWRSRSVDGRYTYFASRAFRDLLAGVPLLLRWKIDGDVFSGERAALPILACLAASATLVPFSWVLGMFMSTAYQDIRRRAATMETLSAISSSRRLFCPPDTPDPRRRVKFLQPMIDLRRPTNVVSWTYLRQVLVDYGRKYRHRAAFYSSWAMAVATIEFAWVFAMLFTLDLDAPQALWHDSDKMIMLVLKYVVDAKLAIPRIQGSSGSRG